VSSVHDSGIAQAGEFADKPGTWEPTRAFLKLSIGFLIGCSALFEILLLAHGQGYSLRTLLVASLGGLGVAGWWFLRQDRVQQGLLILGSGVWFLLVCAAIPMGGINSISMSVLPVSVLMAGWAWPARTR